MQRSSACFLSASACSARSMAFSLSSFSICIFFLMASMVAGCQRRGAGRQKDAEHREQREHRERREHRHCLPRPAELPKSWGGAVPGGGCPGTSPAARQYLLGTGSPPALAPSGTGGRPPRQASLLPWRSAPTGGTPRVTALGTIRWYWASPGRLCYGYPSGTG